MALVPLRAKWSNQLTTGESVSFVIETKALQACNAIYDPVFRFHNIGTEAFDLEIEYTLDLGSGTDDPLNSGTYTNVVVSASVMAGAMYDYSFGGQQLDGNTAIKVTHVVTVTNSGVLTQIFHAVLSGHAEVQTQFSAGQVTFS